MFTFPFILLAMNFPLIPPIVKHYLYIKLGLEALMAAEEAD